MTRITMSLGLDPRPMKSTDTRRSHRAGIRALPIDLVFVVAFVLVADALASTASVWPFVRVLVGLPVLFFLPGYVLLAVLFPSGDVDQTTGEARAYRTGSIPLSIRLALSFGTSVAILPVFSVLLALSPVGFGANTFLWLLTAHVLVGATIGAVRRLRLPPEERLRLPVGRWMSELVEFVSDGRDRLDTAINVLLVIAIILAASGFAYAVIAPPDETGHTDFMLLTRSDDGEFVSAGYPTNFTRGGAEEIVVGVANNRGSPTDYSVVVELQRVSDRGQTMQIVERSELARYGSTVEPEETWYRPHDVTPDLVGEDLRLVYYLYRGSAPADPSMDTADDHLHLWIDVSLESGADLSEPPG